jgi:hypothetical protein
MQQYIHFITMKIHVSFSEEEAPAERQLYMALSMIQKESYVLMA